MVRLCVLGRKVSSPLLDEELRQMIVLRWQLCEANLLAGEDLPYSAASTRAQLHYQVLAELHTVTEACRAAACRHQVKSRASPRFAMQLDHTSRPCP